MGRLILASWLLLALPGVASAQQDPAETEEDADADARKLYVNGSELYAEGYYEAAIEAFREALALSNRKPLLLNIASALERLGRLEEALDTLIEYRIYADEDDKEALTRRIRNLERRIADERAAKAPEPEPVVPTTTATPAPTPPPPQAALSPRRTAGWAMLGSGLAVATGFGVTAGVTYGRGQAFLEAGDQAGWDATRPLNNTSVALAGVGGAVAVTGLILAVLPDRRSPTAVAWSVSPTPGGAAAQLTFTPRGSR